jgi:hypothetical protein
MDCYEFHTKLLARFDDDLCEHCKKFLTLECPHIDEFVEDAEVDEEF